MNNIILIENAIDRAEGYDDDINISYKHYQLYKITIITMCYNNVFHNIIISDSELRSIKNKEQFVLSLYCDICLNWNRILKGEQDNE